MSYMELDRSNGFCWLAEDENVMWSTTENSDDRYVTTASMVFLLNRVGEVALTFVRNRGWDLPGGHVDEGETSREAAAREVAEELGVNIDGNKLAFKGALLIDGTHPKYPNNSQIKFYNITIGNIPRLRPTLECDDAAWVALDDAAQLASDKWWAQYIHLLK